MADEFKIYSAIQSEQIDFIALVDWINDFQRLNLGISAFENLSKTSPSNFCEDLASKCIDTRNTLSDWGTQREQVVSTAEVHKAWLCPTENEILRSDVVSYKNRTRER